MSVEQMHSENKLAPVFQSSAAASSSAKVHKSKDDQTVDLDKTKSNTVSNSTLQAKSIQDELAKAEEQQVVDKVKVEQDVKSLNDLFPLKNTNLIFEFDKLGEPPVIKVVDKSNKEVIREIPPKDLAELSKALQELADSYSKSGALFNSEV